MNLEEAREQLEYVKGVLERSTQFTLISPWSAWSVGLCGLAAGGYSHLRLRTSLAYGDAIDTLFWVWLTCFVLSVALAIAWTRQRAGREGVSLWNHPVRQGFRHFVTLTAVGGILTAGCLTYRLYFLIPAVWMLCYGAGLIVSSMFSLRELRTLGLFFLLCGTVALFWPVYNPILLMVTFGAGHLVLGTIIHLRYGCRRES